MRRAPSRSCVEQAICAVVRRSGPQPLAALWRKGTASSASTGITQSRVWPSVVRFFCSRCARRAEPWQALVAASTSSSDSGGRPSASVVPEVARLDVWHLMQAFADIRGLGGTANDAAVCRADGDSEGDEARTAERARLSIMIDVELSRVVRRCHCVRGLDAICAGPVALCADAQTAPTEFQP